MFEFGKSLPASKESKLRVVGRGGSGSKLRQVSVSKPIVTVALETDNLAQRHPVDPGGSFYRPTGRGGLGSLSTNTPTALKPLKPLKPPSAILDRFLHGRKPSSSEVQLNEPYQLHKSSPPRRSQSVYYRPKQIQKDIIGIPFFLVF
jgi:hypothetical protein